MSASSTPEAGPNGHPAGLLFKLPSELRLRIYESLFPPDTINLVSIQDRLAKVPNTRLVAGDHVAILATCRRIHDEAKAVLYTNTCFTIHCSWSVVPARYPTIKHLDLFAPPKGDGSMMSIGPRVHINLHQVRCLTLNMKVQGWRWLANPSRWIDQFPSKIAQSSNLRSLHILIFASGYRGAHAIGQEEFDYTIALLGQLRLPREAYVTVGMDLSIGLQSINSRAYYALLNKTKWTDTTLDAYTKRLADLSDEVGSTQNNLNAAQAELLAESNELVNVQTGDVLWFKDPDLREGMRLLSKNIRQFLKNIFTLNKDLQTWSGNIDVLERQSTTILEERGGVIEDA